MYSDPYRGLYGNATLSKHQKGKSVGEWAESDWDVFELNLTLMKETSLTQLNVHTIPFIGYSTVVTLFCNGLNVHTKVMLSKYYAPRLSLE